MENLKIVVVDDSPFSVAMISKILEEKGFEVVGSANSLPEAVEVVSALKPNLVTMDMTMPEADGIECTKAIREIDPNLKVIVISSMMDEEIMRKAKKAKISGYIQKPVDGDELSLLIRRIMAEEELFVELEQLYATAFKEAVTDTYNRFFKSIPAYKNENSLNSELVSQGITVVMGIIGKYSGRMILDMSVDSAKKVACSLLCKDNLSEEYVINMMGEMANIIAGNACSMLNKKNEVFGLRVAPPTVVYGESITISKLKLDTVTSVEADTVFGEIYLNVGFNRSECDE
ncbi:chemotaxis protein CheY [Anaerotignum neopropionicum]|uniref:Stage 0 sporulation protein A homolog n=1 Tax=Anaerotignum neopropionicum TaxID=36847 RepID=A0A136WFS1_9FIRM|nr:response regulator [Anaerotignum neopropionicum]KXL53307.1 chemotaxis protein CheY [Anaerotignum neopropionicum]